MMNETQSNTSTEYNPIQFGARLKSAREALGLQSKDVAAQLRLNEKVILMMEKNHFPSDMPVTFVRGYLRSYGKFLQIPEHEIKIAIEPIKHKPTVPNPETLNNKQQQPVTSGNYFMQILTYLILFTMISLVGIWWYSHSQTENQIDNTALAIPVQVESTPKAAAPAVIPPWRPGAQITTTAQPQATPATTNNAQMNNTKAATPATTKPAVTPAKQTKAQAAEEYDDEDDYQQNDEPAYYSKPNAESSNYNDTDTD